MNSVRNKFQASPATLRVSRTSVLLRLLTARLSCSDLPSGDLTEGQAEAEVNEAEVREVEAAGPGQVAFGVAGIKPCRCSSPAGVLPLSLRWQAVGQPDLIAPRQPTVV